MDYFKTAIPTHLDIVGYDLPESTLKAKSNHRYSRNIAYAISTPLTKEELDMLIINNLRIVNRFSI